MKLRGEAHTLRWPDRPYRGFSFYTREDMALLAGRDRHVEDCSRLLALKDTRILFLHGTEDEQGDVDKLEKLAQQVRNAESVIVTGADHFFSKQLDAVDETIRQWAEEVTERA